jgi:hypothetical protein
VEGEFGSQNTKSGGAAEFLGENFCNSPSDNFFFKTKKKSQTLPFSMSFDQLIFHPLQTNPLFEPVRNRDITEIKRLLDMGANPRDTWVSITPFGNAIESGYSEGVKLMTTYMKPLPSDVLFEIGQIDTNLVERKVEMLSLLISLGARFDHIGGRLTALHYVIQVSPALVRIILDEYPQLVNDCGTSSRNPPLSYAIGNIWETGDDLHGLRETVFLLLERGADPNHLPRTEISFPISLLFIRNYQKYHDEGGKIQEDILKKLLECGSQLPWLQRLTPKKQRFALELLSIICFSLFYFGFQLTQFSHPSPIFFT